MRAARLLALGVLLMCLTVPGVRAQDASSAVSGAASTASGAASQASGLLGLLQAAAGAIKKCKAKCCACPCGQMITNALAPMNMFLGGLICPPCCPPVNPDDLKKPSTSLAGACAKLKQEELEMPARREAVKCIARADCNWHPEIQVALLTALRTDPNECVRLEAALALQTGCCCTRKTIEALVIVVTGSNKDGNPRENSDRVKAAAEGALKHCLCSFKEEETEGKRPEKPVAQENSVTAIMLASGDSSIREEAERVLKEREEARSKDKLLDDAHRALVVAGQNKLKVTSYSTGRRNLLNIVQSAQGQERTTMNPNVPLPPSRGSRGDDTTTPQPPLANDTSKLTGIAPMDGFPVNPDAGQVAEKTVRHYEPTDVHWQAKSPPSGKILRCTETNSHKQ